MRPGLDVELPKALRDALLLLATQSQVHAVYEELQHIVNGDQTEVPELNFEALPAGEWKEGVEAYAKLTLDEVWERLGLPDKHIPGFNKVQDRIGGFDAWSPEGQAGLKSDRATPLELRWHQAIGVLKAMDNGMHGKPVLLMDEVGVGKTMQAVAYCALYSYFREYYAKHKEFPGMWSEYTRACHRDARR